MKQFDEDRVEEFDFIVGKKIFPFVKVNPIKKSSTAVLCSFGLNGSAKFIKYLNYPCFDNVDFICYDQRAQSKNKLKPSMWHTTYINDMNLVINEYLKQNPNIKKLYIIGESWGASIAFLYKKKYPKNIDGVLGWNMPYEVIDTSKKQRNNTILKFKVALTLFTGINTNGATILSHDTTNNKAIQKLILSSRNKLISNKVIIASWRSFKRAWRYFLKNPDENFVYIQTGEDNMKSKRLFKDGKKYKNVIMYEKGTHLLSFDINVADKLFDEIKEFINK
ncbi:MAG: alpha/beta fold hydrolase [Mycoplasmoidaceae bacterium]